jgi:transcription elongation factor Elf1
MQHHNKPPKQINQQQINQTIQCMVCDQLKSALGATKFHALDVCAPCAQRLSTLLPKSQTKAHQA